MNLHTLFRPPIRLAVSSLKHDMIWRNPLRLSFPVFTSSFIEEAAVEEAEAFFTAIKSGDLPGVERMLRKNPALAEARDEEGISPILVAMYYGEPDIAHRITRMGVPLSIFDAAATGDLDRVAELLQRDAALANAFAPDGFQPLGLAAFFGHLSVVEFLLIRGAEVNTPSKNSLTVRPLHSAAAGQHLQIARALLEQGANPNLQQAGDFTPMHSAAQNGQLEMILLLLEYDADLNLKSAEGLTPLDMAMEKGHTQAIELLREHGAL